MLIDSHMRSLRCVLCPGKTVDVYLVDFQKLPVLYRGIPNCAMACIFVWGLSSPVKKHLWSSSRVNDVSLEKLLAQAWTLMKGEASVEEPVVSPAQPAQISQQSMVMISSVTCFKCNGSNHFVRDYVWRGQTTFVCCYQCNKTSYLVRDCPWNEVGDETMTLAYSPGNRWTQCYLLSLYIDGTPCLAHFDSGCSCSILSAKLFWSWSKQVVTILTGVTQACCRSGTITIYTATGNTAMIDVLVIWGKPLDFLLLLGINAIKALSNVCITVSGSIKFEKTWPICAVLHFNKTDFCARFDYGKVCAIH